ncbi:MAG: flavodoxin [Candidatus Lokiarchaeota archaeon]|nr:flavodoxin [Candidatus Lokiarchaeota archaeon]
MSKILVVYYSLTGNTKLIAETIAESINAKILALKPVKELKAESGRTYIWGGYQAKMKRKPKLKEFDINPLDYELIILGTPVWAWTFSPPIRSFLSKFNLSNKNVALFMSHDGRGVKAMKRFKEILKDSNILGEIGFEKPQKYEQNEIKEKAIAWVKEIV